MKKSLFTFLVGVIFCHVALSQQDVIYLKDSSIIRGDITSYKPGENVEITTTCCGNLVIAMDKIDKIEKENTTSNNLDGKKVTDTSAVTNEIVDPEKEEKKERRQKIFLNILDNTVDVLTAAATSEPSQSSDPSTETSDPQSSEPEETTPAQTSVGNGCFVNPNFYSRRIKLVHTVSNKRQDITLQPQSEGCLYDLPTGTYDYEVYTTFSMRMIFKAQIQIFEGQTNKVELSEDNLN